MARHRLGHFLRRVATGLVRRAGTPWMRAVQAGLDRLAARDWPGAEVAGLDLIARRGNRPDGYRIFAAGLRAQKMWPQEAAARARLIAAVRTPRPDDWHLLGQARERMGLYRLAADAYDRAITCAGRQAKADWHYDLGFVLERCDAPEAAGAYVAALAADTGLEANRFGIGVFHQSRERWPEAAAAYAARLAQTKTSEPALLYRAGYAFDRCYDWNAAAKYVEAALTHAPEQASWWARLGYIHERQERFDAAATAYATATEHAPRPDWIYRLGYVRARAGDLRAACETFLALDLETASILLGPEGIAARRRAVETANDHNPALYFALGRALMQAGDHAAACAAFRNVAVLQRPHGLEPGQFPEHVLQRRNVYAEYRAVLKVESRTILFESFNGATLTCNPYALYRRIAQDARFANHRFVWTCNRPDAAPADIRADPRVTLVRRESDLYLRHLASAAYLINNGGFPPYFVRRCAQKNLATWHGTPFKTLGKRQKCGVLAHKRAQRSFLQATHLISPNRHTTDVLLDDYDLRGVHSGLLAETGYPRIDGTLGVTPDRRRALLLAMGLDGTRPVIFYAPTWRGDLATAHIDIDRLMHDLQGFPAGADVIFRGHHLVEAQLRGRDLPCRLVPAHLDSNEVLAVADILVTDYSSVLFDYILCDKPLVLYVYDRSAYAAERGLYFDPDDMPGLTVETSADLFRVLADLMTATEPRLINNASAREAFCPHEDGRASDRVMAFFFDDDRTHVVIHEDARANLLMHPDELATEDERASFAALQRTLAKGESRPITLLDTSGPRSDSATSAWLDRLDTTAPLIARYGAMAESVEESWLRRQYEDPLITPLTGARLEGVAALFVREFERIIGLARVDTIIGLGGDDSALRGLLRFAPQELRDGTATVPRSPHNDAQT